MRDLDAVRQRIEAAALRAGRRPDEVRIVAVTKGHPPAAVADAVVAGLTDIGENRVQEAQAKRAAVGEQGARWHMLGHLQQNKAAVAARVFDMVQSLDSPRVARALARQRTAGEPLDVLLEVELTGIAARTGSPPGDADDLLTAVVGLPSLRALGLMTIAPPGAVEAARSVFAELRRLRDRLVDRHGVPLPQLSMGMSDDFEVAVEEGATIVRLGRVLFGDRPPVS